MRYALLVLAASLIGGTVAGCDQLFPELTGATADLAGTGDGGADLGGTSLRGQTCLLADLRAPQSCKNAALGRRVTLEENRASADVASDGSFTLSLAGITDRATLAVSDSTGGLGRSTPTVSVLTGNVLAGARVNGIMVPVVEEPTMVSLELASGATSDPTRGAVIAWLLDATGAAVRDASAARITGAIGPLYDTPASSILDATDSSGAFGTVAFLDLPAGTASITIAVPLGAKVRGDSFALPVRGGAVTVAALQLPAP